MQEIGGMSKTCG